MPAACYGHADVGCLHIRPIINVKTDEGVETLRAIAREVSDLVVEFGGAMSGEHGDGLARSLWNRKLFGPEVYAAFEAVKRAFDPANRLNPGKVVGDADPGDNLRIGPDYHPHEPDQTVLDFSGQGGFARAVEMCSGVGACRKTDGGTMCPSYMVTRDEKHTTRGRANAAPAGDDRRTAVRRRRLRQRDPARGARPLPPVQGVQERVPVERRHGQAQGRSPPPVLPGPAASARSPADGPHLPPQPARLGDRPAGQLDARATRRSSGSSRKPPASTAGGRCRRSPTTTSASGFDRHVPTRRAGTRGTVVLLDDCFTTYNKPEVGLAAVRVLEAAGYRVELAGLRVLRPAGDLQGAAAAGRELAASERSEAAAVRPREALRSSAASRAAC